MRKSILLILLVLFNIYGTFGQSTTWFKVKDIDAAYSISYPQEPEKGSSEVPTDRGPVNMSTYTLQVDNDENLIYMTSFTEYPESFFPDKLTTLEKQDEVLENSVNGAVTNTKGTLIFKKTINFNGFRGRDVKIEIGGGFIIKMKLLLVDIKLYIIQVIYKKENDNNTRAKQFFDSFELINVKR